MMAAMSRDALTVFMIGGLSDFDVAGNQSARKSVEFLTRMGYRIEYWSFFPESFDNLRPALEVAAPPFRMHRLPGGLGHAFRLAKKGKNKIGRRGASTAGSNDSVSYHGDYNLFGRGLYILALFLVVLPIDVFRVGVRALRRRPDIFYGINAQGAITAWVLGKLFRRPVVTRFHGTSLTLADVATPSMRRRLADEVIALSLPADAVIMTNDGTQGDRVLRACGVAEEKIQFWLNGVDAAALKPSADRRVIERRLGLVGKRVILMVSRLARWKRVDRGIRALAALAPAVAGDTVLVIVGDGPELSNLKALARDLGVADQVHFLGAVDHQSVADYFSIAEAFLSAYDISNLGNPLLEAVFFAVPVITLSDGSVEVFLKDGVNALLVDPRNAAHELPIALSRVLEDAALASALRAGLRILAKSALWSWEDRMAVESDLLQRVARRK